MPIQFETRENETNEKVLAFIDEWNAPTSEIVVHTSGSTGKPKKIVLRKQHMIASAKATGEFLGLKKGDRALLCLSMDTIGGRMMVVRALVLELKLIVVDVSSNPLANVDGNITFAAMVPMQVQNCLDANLSRFANIEQLIIGGAAVSEKLIDQLQELSTKVFHTFGMTETISHIAMRSLNHPREGQFSCLPGISVDEKNSSLVIDAPTIGVHNLQTNDAIELLSPTSFRWLGRTDFVINSGGVKLHPEEIELKLVNLIVRPFFVSGEPDTRLGEKLILWVESVQRLNLKKSDFASLLANYSIPKEIKYLNKFAYTSSGKIDRITSKSLPHVALEIL